MVARKLAAAALMVALMPLWAAAEEIALFNGKDLTGWGFFLQGKDAKWRDVWSISDGIIHCKGKPLGYLFTEKEYENYVLTLEWRWMPGSKGGNSGVFVHVVGENKIWPKGIEAQLMAGHAGDFWLVGDVALTVDKKRQDPKIARHYFRMKDDVEKPIGEWNRYEITCKKDRVELVINGEAVNVGEDAELTKGKIILQSEGAPIEFRNIKLRTLE
jgi:hypothetical protein